MEKSNGNKDTELEAKRERLRRAQTELNEAFDDIGRAQAEYHRAMDRVSKAILEVPQAVFEFKAEVDEMDRLLAGKEKPRWR